MTQVLSSFGGSDERENRVAETLSELTDRLAWQTADEVRDWIEQQGELAGLLDQWLPSLEQLASLGQQAIYSSDDPTEIVDTRVPLGDFELVREIGRGGMGVVYEAKQRSLDRRVAVKILPLGASMDQRRVARFRNEAGLVATLKHPHIIPLYCIGFEAGVHFYAMQLIDGITLARYLVDQANDDRPRDCRYDHQVALWAVQIASALGHAHELGVIHRDIKPSNLMLDAQQDIWVTDFGVARLVPMSNQEMSPGLTQSGQVPGTLRYMSPEQATGSQALIDHRSDLYSLGAVLFELLCGAPLVSGESPVEILDQLYQARLPEFNHRSPSISPDLQTIVMKSVSHHPSDRYDSAAALVADLTAFLDSRPITARRPTLWRRWQLWQARNTALLRGCYAFAVFALIGSASAAGLVAHHRQAYLHERQMRMAERASLDQQETMQRANRTANSIQLAYQAWLNIDQSGMVAHLEACQPDRDGADSASFEWRYLNALRLSVPKPLGRHRGEAYSIRFHADGDSFATSGDDGVRVWDLASGNMREHLDLPEDDASAIELWRLVRSQVDFGGQISDLIVSLDRDHVVFRGRESELLLVNVQTKETLSSIPIAGRIASLAINDDRSLLAFADGQGQVFWGLIDRSNKDRLALSVLPPIRMAANAIESLHFQAIDRASGTQNLVTSSRDGTAGIWTLQVDDRAVRLIDQRHFRTTCPLWDAKLSRSGDYLITTDRAGQVCRWKLSEPTLQNPRRRWLSPWVQSGGEDLRAIAESSYFNGLSPDRVLAVVPENGSLVFWDTWGNERIAMLSEADLCRIDPRYRGLPVHQASFSPDGTQLAVTAGGEVSIFGIQRQFDARHQRLAVELTAVDLADSLISPRPSRWHWHPERPWVAVVYAAGSRGEVFDMQHGRRIAELGDGIAGVQWSPDGHRLITCQYDGVFHVFSGETMKEETRFVGPGHSRIAITPDGQTLAGSAGDEIILWNMTCFRELLRIPLPAGGVLHSLHFSADGRSLVAERQQGPGIVQIVWELP